MTWDLVAYYVKKALAIGMIASVAVAVVIFWVAACIGISVVLVFVWENLLHPLMVAGAALLVALVTWIQK